MVFVQRQNGGFCTRLCSHLVLELMWCRVVVFFSKIIFKYCFLGEWIYLILAENSPSLLSSNFVLDMKEVALELCRIFQKLLPLQRWSKCHLIYVKQISSNDGKTVGSFDRSQILSGNNQNLMRDTENTICCKHQIELQF